MEKSFQAVSSTGSSTDGEVPMTGHAELDSLLNTIEDLISRDGHDDIMEHFDGLCDALESLNECLEINFPYLQEATASWDEMLRQRPRAFQQIIYLLKVVGVEKNLWKRLLPSLVFARLTKKTLGNAQRWVPPRRRRKRKFAEKTKKLAGISYMVSIKKMLREAIEGRDMEALEQIMKELQDNMPFGSAANLFDGVQEFRENRDREIKLKTRKKKMRHCYYAKVGKNAMPKLADEHFCTVHRRFLLPFRDPTKEKQMTLENELEETGSHSDSSDSSDVEVE